MTSRKIPPPPSADPPRELSAEDRQFIGKAVQYLENPSFLMRAANVVGKPAEGLIHRLPDRAHKMVARSVQKAMETALGAAIKSLDDAQPVETKGSVSERHALTFRHGAAHSAASAAAGFAGGLFGLAGLPVELPVTTLVMLRSIAAIARDLGMDLSDPEVRLECLAVLALGGKMPTPIDATLDGDQPAGELSAMESAYYTSRLGLALALRSASQYVATAAAHELAKDLGRGAAPVLTRLIAMIASRFQTVVGEKAVAQAVPLLGAATGAALNAAFTDHFNHVARYHFGLRALERRYGEPMVRKAYAHELEVQRAKSLK